MIHMKCEDLFAKQKIHMKCQEIYFEEKKIFENIICCS